MIWATTTESLSAIRDGGGQTGAEVQLAVARLELEQSAITSEALV